MSDTPSVSVQTMHLSDGRSDHYVSITVGDRQVHPHMFRDEYKAAYHVALYQWLFAGGEEPDVLDFDDGDFPAQATALVGPASWQHMSSAPKEGKFLAETKAGDWLQVERYDNPHGFKNTVIDNRTGRWWTPARWMPLPPTNEPKGISE